MKIKIKIEKNYIIDSFYTTMRIYTDKSVIACMTMDRIHLKCDQIENKNNFKQVFMALLIFIQFFFYVEQHWFNLFWPHGTDWLSAFKFSIDKLDCHLNKYKSQTKTVCYWIFWAEKKRRLWTLITVLRDLSICWYIGHKKRFNWNIWYSGFEKKIRKTSKNLSINRFFMTFWNNNRNKLFGCLFSICRLA